MDQLVGKPLQQRQIDFDVAQIDILQADLFAQRPQRRFFPDVPQRHRLLHQRRTVSVRLTQLTQLPFVQQAASFEQFTSFHCFTISYERDRTRRIFPPLSRRQPAAQCSALEHSALEHSALEHSAQEDALHTTRRVVLSGVYPTVVVGVSSHAGRGAGCSDVVPRGPQETIAL